MHLLSVGSKNNLNYRLQDEKIIKSVNKFLGTELNQFSKSDNLEKIYKKISVQEMKDFLSNIIQYLIKSKKIKKKNLLLNEYYMIGIDMTQTHKLNTNKLQSGKEIKGLLFQKSNGKKIYSRKVVEAKLLLFNGLSIPLMSEFVRNDDSVDGKFIKQDCELNAAYRLIDNIKKEYPRLKICLLLDGLYPNETIFKKCKKNNWKYIITLKEKKIPTLYKNFIEFKRLENYEEKKKQITFNINQRYKFVKLKYLEFDLTCIQVKEYKNKKTEYFNLFITNLDVEKDNVYKISSGGRLRWKIEHSFNKQKNLLFNLKHVYSKNENASQCYHILLQIADLIFQFMSYTLTSNGENILYDVFGSLIEFLHEIYVSFREKIGNIEKYFLVKHLILKAPKKK